MPQRYVKAYQELTATLISVIVSLRNSIYLKYVSLSIIGVVVFGLAIIGAQNIC